MSPQADCLAASPTLRSYLIRAGVDLSRITFRRFPIMEDAESDYPIIRHTIKMTAEGVLKGYPNDCAPTEEEAVAIKAEVLAANWPKSIAHRRGTLPPELVDVDKASISEFSSQCGKKVLFIEQRIETKDFGKVVLPWSFWSDGEWRRMNPDGLLPLYGLDRLKGASPVFLHEGAKTAWAVQALVDDDGEALAAHPWANEIRDGVHLGWPGGAPNSHVVDWAPIRRLSKYVRVIIIADNDQPGKEAITKISQQLSRPLVAVLFDDRFPETFDLADNWPDSPDWWRGARYTGPTLDDLSTPATWATSSVKGEKGRPKIMVRDQFAAEWLWAELPPVFIHRRQSDRLRTKDVFNSAVRPFSHVDNTARLLTRHFSSKCDGVIYRPVRVTARRHRELVITENGRRLINTYRPSDIVPAEGDPERWLNFLVHLVPDESDRMEVMRWCATLIARPDIRMRYSILLVSETQGVGKTTLGEAILAPLVGWWNVSVPNESQVVESQFNGWVAHKRLALVHEIYSGQSRKAYDRLKSVITDSCVNVNEKYIPGYEIENWCSIFASSNSLMALHLDHEDRRWLVPRITEEQKPVEYWHRLYKWLNSGGLAIIADWAEKFLEVNAPVRTGDHAPMTSAKAEVITELRSEGQRLAYDLARLVADMDERVVFVVDEVRDWVAVERAIELNDRRLERLLTIRKALKAGGLREPERDPSKTERRMKIGTRYKNVVANFEIGAHETWTDIKLKHKAPEDMVDM